MKVKTIISLTVITIFLYVITVNGEETDEENKDVITDFPFTDNEDKNLSTTEKTAILYNKKFNITIDTSHSIPKDNRTFVPSPEFPLYEFNRVPVTPVYPESKQNYHSFLNHQKPIKFDFIPPNSIGSVHPVQNNNLKHQGYFSPASGEREKNSRTPSTLSNSWDIIYPPKFKQKQKENVVFPEESKEVVNTVSEDDQEDDDLENAVLKTINEENAWNKEVSSKAPQTDVSLSIPYKRRPYSQTRPEKIQKDRERGVPQVKDNPYPFYRDPESSPSPTSDSYHFASPESVDIKPKPSPKYHVSPWKRIVHLLTALVPIGLFLSALTPSIMVVNPMNNSSMPQRYRGVDSVNHEAEHHQQRLLALLQGRVAGDITCRETTALCEAAVRGRTPGAVGLDKALWTIANQAHNLKQGPADLMELFEAIHENSCEKITCSDKDSSKLT